MLKFLKIPLFTLSLFLLLPSTSFAQRQSAILSPPSPSQVVANGASDNVTFSADNRLVRLAAYDSVANNLVVNDTNNQRDVFLVKRGAGLGNLSGSLERASLNSQEQEANGASSFPSIDGDTQRSPHCVVFQSNATNLDRKDRSPDSDIFLRDIRRGTTSLVSFGHSSASSGVVDGECEFVTYQAQGRVWVRDLKRNRTTYLGSGSDPDQSTSGKAVAYQRAGQIYVQYYQRVFNRGKPAVKRQGRAVLASQARAGRGNGTSQNPVMDDSGFYVAFESNATNLCINTCQGVSTDRNGPVTDVFRRTLQRRLTPKGRAPTFDLMQMVSYSNSVDEQGNGPSNNPSMTGAGENIVFDSAATNLRQSLSAQPDQNGSTRDIYYWVFPRARGFGNVSRESRPGRLAGAFNGDSVNPAASNRSNYIGFTSVQTGAVGEANGPIPDVFWRFLGGDPEGSINR